MHLRGNIRLPGSTYPPVASNKKLNHRASASSEASNPKTSSSHRLFMLYDPLAPTVRVTLTLTHNCNQIYLVYMLLFHVKFSDFEDPADD